MASRNFYRIISSHCLTFACHAQMFLMFWGAFGCVRVLLNVRMLCNILWKSFGLFGCNLLWTFFAQTCQRSVMKVLQRWMFSNVFECIWMFSNVSGSYRMRSSTCKYCWMFSNAFRCIRKLSDVMLRPGTFCQKYFLLFCVVRDPRP